MKKALVIYNPVSGNKKLRDLEALIKKQLKADKFEYEWYETKPVKNQNFDKFKKKKFDRIIAVGGDGTVAETAAFIIKNKIKTPLGIIPTGSANVLAIALKLSLVSVTKAIKTALTGKPLAIDAMEINRKNYGLIATGCGYDTYIMHKTTRSLKRHLGFFAYIWNIVKSFFGYKKRPFKLTIDGKRITVMAKAIMVFNIAPYGPFKIDPTDGKVEIFVVNPGVKIEKYSGKKIHIKIKKERKFQIDGDLYKKGKTMEINVIPKAINISQ